MAQAMPVATDIGATSSPAPVCWAMPAQPDTASQPSPAITVESPTPDEEDASRSRQASMESVPPKREESGKRLSRKGSEEVIVVTTRVQPRMSVSVNAANWNQVGAIDDEPLGAKLLPEDDAGVASRNTRLSVGLAPEQQEAFSACLARYLDTKVYMTVSAAALVIALFGGAFAVITNIPDDPGNALIDVLMTLVTVFFVVEILLLSVAGGGYPLSFFFWMDVLGTISMVFEISYMLGTAGKMQEKDTEVNPVLLRSARAAKVGARAARLSKVFKCFTFHTRRARDSVMKVKDGGKSPEYDAQSLKQRINNSLSAKVSMLTVVLVIITPLFNIGRYPEEDFSMKGWVRVLELDYGKAWKQLEHNASLTSVSSFSATVSEMTSFYDDLNYSPYKIEGYQSQVIIDSRKASILGDSLVHGDVPARKQNILRQQVKSCMQLRPGCSGSSKASIYFDFQMPNQYEAILDVGVICFIMCCMILEAWDLSRSVDTLIVRPVEKMLGTVQMMASILKALKSKFPNIDNDDSGTSSVTTLGSWEDALVDSENASEAEVLEMVFQKFNVLVAKFLETDIAEEQEMLEMATDMEGQGVIQDILGFSEEKAQHLVSEAIKTPATGKVVADLPVDEETCDSWQLNLMEMSPEDQTKIVRYYIFDHETDSPGRIWVDVSTFFKFHELVRLQYYDSNPYHNYTHACDVVASVFRVFRRLRCREWLSDIDMYALLVSALCHDISHPGRTTPFLVETRHELALRYNDNSPLENMHCAKLFEICGQQGANIFKKFEKDAYKQARKVCIVSILHTDNAQHFEMVKGVKETYEITSDICDAQASDLENFSQAYMDEVLCKHQTLWQKLILHLCDVATPLKPWSISRAWATRVQDEFFNQGDEEKRLGIPVGMLNDREKVSRSGAEHGFINFLVSPLVIPTVGNFPALLHLATQMLENLKEWRNLWVQDTKPSPEEIGKRDADVKRVADQIEKLRVRKPITTIRTGQQPIGKETSKTTANTS